MAEELKYDELKKIALESLEQEERALNELKIVDQEMTALKNDNARLKKELKRYKDFLPIKMALKVKKKMTKQG
jgi:cell shape-determining protein MreC